MLGGSGRPGGGVGRRPHGSSPPSEEMTWDSPSRPSDKSLGGIRRRATQATTATSSRTATRRTTAQSAKGRTGTSAAPGADSSNN
ncbi:hypothetical protein NKH77_56030 [Streptomyces sp. M19]